MRLGGSFLLLAASLAALPLPARGGPATAPEGGVGVSFNCESANDSSFTAGAARATDDLQFVFPAGGANLARTRLGYTVNISDTIVNLDSTIALPQATTAEDCLIGGSLFLNQPIGFTGNISNTVAVELAVFLDEWIVEVPSTAPVDADASFGFDVGLDTAQAAESFVVTPAGGVSATLNPTAWTISALGGGRFSVSGGLNITATLDAAAPPPVTLDADSAVFVPGGTTGFTMTNRVPRALRFQVVSLQSDVTVIPLGVPPPELQSKPQQKCLAALNAAAANVVRAQTRLNEKCLKDATKGKTPSAQDCVAADPQDKVGKASLKVMRADEQKCTKDPEQLPGFSYVSSTALYPAAMGEGLAFLGDLLGPDADLAIRTDSREVACQGKVLALSDKYLDVLLKEAIRIKKDALKAGADTSVALEAAIDAGFGDAEKVLRAASRLVAGADQKCAGVADLGAVFPGAVAVGVTPGAISEHAIERARCRACRLVNAFDDLALDCDTIDEGAPNASCS